jgi:hypothetical protein
LKIGQEERIVHENALREHLIRLLQEGQAHITLQDAVKDFPVDKAGIRPGNSPHSAWEILEHIRIAQADITHFSGVLEESPRSAGSREQPNGYVPLKWPEDYWPESPAPRDASAWERSAASIEEDLAVFLRIVRDPERDLFQPFPWGDGQTLLREALLIADHNAYHVGQLMLVRRMVE